MQGIDYQPGGSSNLVDPLADATTCARDIAKFKDLGLNTVRIYTVDNTADHSACMGLLADAGIYLILDVNSPKYSLNRANAAPSYNAVYLQNIFATIDKFANYTNTLAFFSANEVINDGTTTAAARYVKAVTRDMRQYLKARSYRQIPVGYSAADVSENRMDMAHYMNCGTDDERSDFFGFNDYSWCSPSSFEKSGWDQKVKNFTGYGIPIFLSEFGCIINTRKFDELDALYSTDMTAVYSGGLVYEYTMETNGYGIVKVDSDTSVSELDGYAVLKKQLAANPPPTGDGGYESSSTASDCPAYSSTWNVTDNTLPSIPDEAAEYMTKGAGAGVGLTGDGSQWAGSTSTGTASAGSGSVVATASGGAAPSSTARSTAGRTIARTSELTPVLVGVLVTGLMGVGAFLL